MIIQCVDKVNDIFYGESYISLHNLFTGPPKYTIEMNSQTNVLLSFDVECDSTRDINLSFSHLHLQNFPFKSASYITYKIYIYIV